MILKYTVAWLGLLILAILNGTLRELAYGKHLRELTAHQVSTLTGILISGVYIWLLSRKWKLRTTRQAVQIGGIWLALTLAFEFLFGHYVMGHPWSRLFQDYNLLEGRVWVFFLAFTALAPYLLNRPDRT